MDVFKVFRGIINYILQYLYIPIGLCQCGHIQTIYIQQIYLNISTRWPFRSLYIASKHS